MQAQAQIQTSTFLTARWVLPIASAPVENAVVEFAGGKVQSVQSRSEFLNRHPGGTLKDYGQAVIMPGLVNMHTHVDYSALRRFDTQSGLFPWIRGLIKEAFQWTPQQWLASAELGARELALSGTTCVADSSYTGTAAAAAFSRLGLRAVIGLELFGTNSRGSDRAFALWLNRLESLKNSSPAHVLQQGRIQFTVSPHAPYTVCPSLWSQAVDWAAASQLPVLCHVSESLPECRWIAGEDEEVEAFLAAVDPGYSSADRRSKDWKGQGRTPVEHLDHYQLLTGTTVAAHAVHLNDNDMRLLSQRRVKVAHCPRSNARLRNGVAPVNRLMEAGVEVGFGTDSSASSDSLDVLSEARFAWNLQRAVDPSFKRTAQEAIYGLTLGAARMLNLDSKIGSIEPGKEADLAIFSLDSGAGENSEGPYEDLLYGEPLLQDLFVQGRQIVSSGELS